MQSSPKLPPRPPVGLPVVWYEHGNVNPGKGYPAFVTEATDRGTISLLVIKPSGHQKTVRGTWFAHDPTLPMRDHMQRTSRGCWDYLPVESLQVDLNRPAVRVADLLAEVAALRAELAELRCTRAEPAEDDDGFEERIVELADKGLGAVEIAEQVGTTHQKVNAILRRAKAAT